MAGFTRMARDPSRSCPPAWCRFWRSSSRTRPPSLGSSAPSCSNRTTNGPCSRRATWPARRWPNCSNPRLSICPLWQA